MRKRSALAVTSIFHSYARVFAAVGRIRLWPTGGSTLLSLAHDGTFGNTAAAVHCNTLLQILGQLRPCPRHVAVQTAVSNFAYVGKILGWYHNARLLVPPAGLFSWNVAIYDNSVQRQPTATTTCEVRYDYRPGLLLGSNEYTLPYGMHPALSHRFGAQRLQEWIRELRTVSRQRRVFFAGSTGKLYSKAAQSPALRGKLDRNAVVALLAEAEGFRTALTLGEIAPRHREEMLVVDAGACPISVDAWLPALATADFAVCPPGCLMPMCFNIIEAMGVGTIPITNYPEWFYPALEDGHTCIAFDTPADLLRRLQEVRMLPASRIAEMRQTVCHYYDRHLAPGTLPRQLTAHAGQHMILHVLDETVGHLSTVS